MNDTIELFVNEFADNVAAQADAIHNGLSRIGNKHAKRYMNAFAQLRALGDRGRDALVPLLSHPRSDVRIAAAAYLLRHRTSEATAVLEAESHRPGLSGFEAQQALKRWREGAWSLDPPDSPA
jgi:hypothetical protein